MSNEAKLKELGDMYKAVADNIKSLTETKDKIKEELLKLFKELNIEQLKVPVGDNVHEYVFNRRKKSTKSFDKESLSKEIECTRSDLDYVGIAKFVEEGELNADYIGNFQKTNDSEFVTVRVKVANTDRKSD